jgi:hypothetical protein
LRERNKQLEKQIEELQKANNRIEMDAFISEDDIIIIDAPTVSDQKPLFKLKLLKLNLDLLVIPKNIKLQTISNLLPVDNETEYDLAANDNFINF